MNFEKLKETARKYEQKEDWRRAIEVYLQAVREFESGHEPIPDLSVYNRIGDLYLKANESGAAVQAYERAIDLYGEQGFYNNAIALCGKILRVNPGRTQTYLKLAHLHARKNVVIEAKKNLLEYLDRMHAQGHLDEAFKAVTAFAEQYPSNKEIRLMLSELLRASSRNAEAREQLEKLASDLEARGDTIGARKTLMRLQALDSDAIASAEAAPKPPSKRSNDLIFLDTGTAAGLGEGGKAGSRLSRKTLSHPKPPSGPVAPGGVPLIDVEGAPAPLEIETSSLAAEPLELESVRPISEEAHLDATASGDIAKALGFEPTTPEVEEDVDVPPLEGLEIDRQERDSLRLTSIESPIEIESQQEETGPTLESTSAGDVLSGGAFDAETTALDIEPIPGIELGRETGVFDESDFEIEAADREEGVEVEAVAGDDVAEVEAVAAVQEEERVSFLEVEPTDESGPTIEELEDRVLDDPDNPDIHRLLGETLLAVGEQARGQEELEIALSGYEGREDWQRADDVIDALVRMDPNAVRFHQKRVEIGFRTGDRARLVDAYLELADALLRVGAMDKALAVYRRVADHDPSNTRAQSALEVLAPIDEPAPEPGRVSGEPAAPPPPSLPDGAAARPAGSRPTPVPAPVPTPVPAPAARVEPVGDFIDLSALILEDEKIRDTRMKVEAEQPTGDEQRDFQDMLSQFKRGIEENIDAEDFQSHYDLGVAFKEMGLLDEAISEFQKALRAPEGRLKTSEALGTAFFEKGQFAIAEAILKRAVESLGATDDEQIGLIYWLARSQEAQGNAAAAIPSYQRVLAVEIGFQDAGARMSKLSRGGGA
jgi:tetratricopeptide (TPR) repeat protein